MAPRGDRLQRAMSVLVAVLLVVSVFGPAVSLVGLEGGPVGTAAADHGGVDLDDFEDGDTNVETAGWNGWNGDTGSFSVESSTPLEGSSSGKLSSSNAVNQVNVQKDSGSSTVQRIATRIEISADVGSSSDTVQIQVRDSGTRLFRVTFEDGSGDIRVNTGGGGGGSDTGKDWHPDAIYEVEFRDINYSANTFDLYIDGDRLLDDQSFENSGSGFDEIRVQSDTDHAGTSRDVFVDDVELGGDTYTIDKFSAGVVEDFEDSDINIESTGWVGWQGDTGSLSTTGSPALHGSVSGELASSNSIESVDIVSDSGQYTKSRVAAAVNISADTGNSGDGVEVEVRDSDSTRIFSVYFEDSSEDIKVNGANGANTGKDWRPHIVYHIEFRDIDYSANTFDLYLNGERLLDDQAFDNNADGFEQIRVVSDTDNSGGSRDAQIDDVQIGGEAYTEPTIEPGSTEDFEDDTTLDPNTTGWGPTWYGDTGSFTEQTNVVLEGSRSANLTSSNEINTVELFAIRRFSVGRIETHIQISADTGNSGDGVEFIVYDSGARVLSVFFEDGTNTIRANGAAGADTGEDWQPNTEYNVTFADIDYAANTFDIWINGTRFIDDQAFDNNADGFDEAQFLSDTRDAGTSRDVTIDDIQAGACTANCDFTASSATNTVTGRVARASDNGGLNNAEVTAGGQSTTTDTNGEFTLNLEDGTYDFTADKDGFEQNTKTATVSGDTDIGTISLTESDPPFVTDPSPKNKVYKKWKNVTLTFTVNDPEGKDVTYTVSHENSTGDLDPVETDTVSDGTTVTVDVIGTGGSLDWRVELTDADGTEVTSTYTYLGSAFIKVYNGSTGDLNTESMDWDSRSRDSTFRKSKTGVTSGLVDLNETPAGEYVIVDVSSANMLDEDIIVSGNPYTNQTLVLYPSADSADINDTFEEGTDDDKTGADVYEQQFELEDRSGNFPPEDSLLIVEQFYDGEYRTVDQSAFGAGNLANVTLIDDVEYRLKVVNTLNRNDPDAESVRELGGFDGDSSRGTVTLVISTSDVGDPDEDSTADYEWNASIESTDDGGQITFKWNLLNESINVSSFELYIYEFGNRSNREIRNTSYGSINDLTVTTRMNDSFANLTWVVEWQFTNDAGDTVTGSTIVELQKDVIPELPDWLTYVIFIGAIFITAGLASQQNGHVVALIVAGLAGMLWWAGVAPDYVGGGLIALAMLMAAAFYLRERQVASP